MKVFISIALVVTLALVHGQEAEGPLVDTHYGKVKGSTATSRDGRMFYSFKGIPYGKAPERFQNPEIPDNYGGVKDVSSKSTPACIHYSPFTNSVVGQEDCLNLDVFTPKLPVEGKDKILLPVVVYFHPGINKFGSTDEQDPKYGMDGDVVIVMINWRLSVYGFLNTGDMYAAGNQGLRDQVLALMWVQQNIEKFGGNKDSVTLIGAADGGTDALLHTLSPQSKGLFHKVISMSGAPSRQSVIRRPVRQAKKLGEQVGCPIDSSSALVSCLKQKDPKEILEKLGKVDFKLKDITVEDLEKKASFGPTIDKVVSEGQTEQDLIIPDHPYTLLKSGKIINKVPIIIGATEMDGINALTATYLKEKSMMEKLDKEWNDYAPLLFKYKDTATDKDAVSAKIRDFYFGDKAINKETFLNLSNIFMDRFIGFPLVSGAKLYSKEAPVYLYTFIHKPETNLLKFFGLEDNYGMAHLDDLQYLFKINIDRIPYPEITAQHKEYELSKSLIKLFGSFSETGKPVKTWGEGKEWKKNEGGELTNWYKLGPVTELAPVPEIYVKRIGFWQELFGKELAKEMETAEVEPF